MSGDVHDRRVFLIHPANVIASWPWHCQPSPVKRGRDPLGCALFRREGSSHNGNDFCAARKLEHALRIPPRGGRLRVRQDQCAAAKTEKQHHKKDPHDSGRLDADRTCGLGIHSLFIYREPKNISVPSDLYFLLVPPGRIISNQTFSALP